MNQSIILAFSTINMKLLCCLKRAAIVDLKAKIGKAWELCRDEESMLQQQIRDLEVYIRCCYC